jgi:hypothetical protein
MQGGCGALTFRSALRPSKTGVNALLERESIGGIRPAVPSQNVDLRRECDWGSNFGRSDVLHHDSNMPEFH